MAEASATPDPVGLVREGFAAYGRGDFEAAAGFFTPDAVWEMKEGETFEGVAAIRRFMEEFYGQFESFAAEVEEIRDLGGDVLLVVNTMRGRPRGSAGEVQQTGAFIYELRAGLAA